MILMILCPLAVVITSYLVGALFVEKEQGLFAVILGGFLGLMAIWEVLSLVAIFSGMSLTALCLMIQTAIIALLVCSIFRNKGTIIDSWRTCFKSWWDRIVAFFTFKAKPEDVVALVALGMVVIQALLLVIGVHYDDDDAFYVATATTAIDTDTIYRFNPFTGNEYKDLPDRYVLSPWPLFSAVLSYFFNIRPIVVFHTILPALLIPMTYGVLFMMGEAVWKEDPHRQLKSYAFLIAASFLQIFGAFSTWSVGMRLLIRVWQGKTVLASLIIPLLMVLIIRDWESEKLSPKMMLYITVTLVAGCFLSSMGVVLGAIELGALGLTRAVVKRSIKYSIALIPCCTINVLLGVIYLAIR